VTQRVERPRSLVKWTLGFLIQNTPNPEEGLAAAMPIEMILNKEYRPTKESREALRKLAEELAREMYEGGVILEGQPPRGYPSSPGASQPYKEEQPNYYY